jgi:hypothetical protein
VNKPSRAPLIVALGATGAVALAIVVIAALLLGRWLGEEDVPPPPPEPPSVDVTGSEFELPPHNNEWSGFPVGSWLEQEYTYDPGPGRPGAKRGARIKLFVSEVSANGGVSMQTFSWKAGKWVRNLHTNASGTGVRVTLDGWLPSGQEERTVYDGKEIKTYREPVDWTESKLPDEKLTLGGREVACKVRVWTRGTGAEKQVLKLWFGSGVKIPGRMMNFGRHDLEMLGAPDLVKANWRKGGDWYRGAVASFAESEKIDGRDYRCVLWESSWSEGGKEKRGRWWLHSDIPGREARTEVYDMPGDRLRLAEKTLRFRVLKQPLAPGAVKAKLKPGSWTGFPVDSSAQYTRVKGVSGNETQSWRVWYRGVSDEGYPILERYEIEGPDAGVIISSMQMPLPRIREQDVKVREELKISVEISGRKIPCAELRYSCRDPWGRPWKAVTRTTDRLKLPIRAFDSWFVDATLGPDVIYARAVVGGQTLTSQVTGIDRIVEVGSEKIKCFQEQEVLESSGMTQTTTTWRSARIPGNLVKSISVTDRKGRKQLTVTKLTDFARGE